MIRRVKIQGYKSLKDIEVELQPLTVIIGPNAAGKSNLFDALGLLSRLATSPTLGEAFKEHRGAPVEAFFYGPGGLTWLLTQEAAVFTIEVDVELTPEVVTAVERRIQAATTTTTLAWQSPEVVATVERRIQERQSSEAEPAPRRISETRLRYTLTVEMAMDSGHLGVKVERLVALNPDGTEKASAMPFIQPMGNRLHLWVEGQDRSFEYAVDQDRTLVSTSLYPPYHPHATALKEELSRWRFYYLDPETMRTENPLKEVETLGPFGADLAAFYHTLRTRSPQQFQALNRALRLLLPEVQALSVERTKEEGLLRLLILEGVVSYSARVISEGTLRILGLLAITNPLAPTTVIGYEEPENGVHPRRLQLIAELLQTAATEGKQILVNTHSPKLPEYLEPSSLVVCSKENGATAFVPLQDLGPLFRAGPIERALEETSLMERVLRGDFGG